MHQSAAIATSTDSVSCGPEKTDVSPSYNDSKASSKVPATTVVAAKPKVSGGGGVAPKPGAADGHGHDGGAARPAAKRPEKGEAKARHGVRPGAAEEKPRPTPPRAASRSGKEAGAKGAAPPRAASRNRKEAGAKDAADAASRAPSAKKEHKAPPAEKRATKDAGGPQHPRAAPKGKGGKATTPSPADAHKQKGAAGSAAKCAEATAPSPDSKHPKGDAVAPAAVPEQTHKDGGGSPATKKKKNKKKKKKRKAQNPDKNPTKPSELPDQNQKTKSPAAQASVDDVQPASGNGKKGTESSDNAIVASSTATERPPNSTKSTATAPKQNSPAAATKAKSTTKKETTKKETTKKETTKKETTKKETTKKETTKKETTKKETTKKEKAGVSNEKVADKGPTTPSTTAKTCLPEASKPTAKKGKSNEAHKSDTKDKSESNPHSESPSSPNKMGTSAVHDRHTSPYKKGTSAVHDNHTKIEDADDGAWETVEVKPRGRRGKGGHKKAPAGAPNKMPESYGITHNHGGRHHNYDHAGGNTHEGGGTVHHAGRRRNKRYRNDKRHTNNQLQQPQHKLVKDVILHILDAVDDEVARRAGNAILQGSNANSSHDDQRNRSGSGSHEKRVGLNGEHHGQPQSNDHRRKPPSDAVVRNGLHPPPSMVPQSSAKSLRDVLVGTSAVATPGKAHTKAAKTASSESTDAQNKAKGATDNHEPSKGSSKVKPGMSYKSVIEPPKSPEPQPPQPSPPKAKPNAWAKSPQATVKAEPTPEAAEILGPEQQLPAEKKDTLPDEPIARNDGAGCVPRATPGADVLRPTVADECQDRAVAAVAGGRLAAADPEAAEDGAGAPPLATLLGPGDAGDAASSVASSLEAPHSSNRFRGRPSTSEDDVGYHLLNVCSQLSEEINTFMSRRALALDVRRRERNAVLSAVGDTLGKIWPDQCCVEMYGSCATQLDLPSSDLDLVVCGLDDADNHPPVDPQTMNTVHRNNSSTSFQDEEVPQECVAAPIEPHCREQPLSPEHYLAENSESASFQEGGEPSITPDHFAESVGEGDPGMMLDQSADGIPGIEYSPSAAVENYLPEYHALNQQDGATGTNMANYSPGYSYHSNQQDEEGSENYSSGYQGEEVAVEGYGQEYQTSRQEFYFSPYEYVSPLSLNARRVLRLASELELQPWAVQVKAIPTATVPVVKMLADHCSLPGLAGTGDSWMMQQHIAAQTGVPAGTPTAPIPPEQVSVQTQGSVPSPSHFFSPHPMAQWRGTDIKNGLQPVDITFEGPEHGGIGSTTYSIRVVEDACNKMGLPPEGTPVVQVASVLKELIAQRRLNEPFSGGLSSYGLLMLLLAVLKDRSIIQGEMKKTERQRQKVSGLDDGKAKSVPTQHDCGLGKNCATAVSSSAGVDSSDKSSTTPSTTSKPTVSSSWASIAKKSNGSTAITESLSTITKSTHDSATNLAAKTGANYSEVVQKESQENSKNVRQNKDQILTKNQVEASSNGCSNAVPLAESQRLSVERRQTLPQSRNVALNGPAAAVLSQVTPTSEDDSKIESSSVPQGSNDVLEVLCSGELTSGKLLMHFLLFYGQHFDSQATLVDMNGTHHPDYGKVELESLSPFVPRPPGGTIDPITGMFSVDPIVVYDPLEGANDHNVSKRCYCWNNVRWVFAQCYMTVSGVVETSDTCTSSSHPKHKRNSADVNGKSCSVKSAEKTGDAVSPILELLLSF